MLHGLELVIDNAELGVTHDEDVESHAARAQGCSCDFQLHTVLCIHEPKAAAVQRVVLHGPEIDEQPELVTCVELCGFVVLASFGAACIFATMAFYFVPRLSIPCSGCNLVGHAVHAV